LAGIEVRAIPWWLAAYVGTVVVLNVAFEIVPIIDTPLGPWPPAALLAGAVFIVRDFAQRAHGHWVLAAMVLGGAISYFAASPAIATASLVAFAASEGLDWLVYTVLKRRPFGQRIVASSLLSTPFDSVIFLGMIGFLSPVAFVLMTLSKLAGLIVVPFVNARRRGI